MLNYIPLIVIVLGLLVMAFFLLRKKSSGHASRQKAVEELGWSYEKGSSVYVAGENQENAALSFSVKGKVNNNSWILKSYLYLEINNTVHNPYSIFRCEKSFTENSYFYSAPNPGTGVKTDYLDLINNSKTGNILSRYIMDSSIVEKLKLVETRNEFFNKNYYIYSSDSSIAGRVTGKDTQYYLNNFTNKIKDVSKWPLISINPQFLEIKVMWTLDKPEDIKSFADLGIALIKNI